MDRRSCDASTSRSGGGSLNENPVTLTQDGASSLRQRSQLYGWLSRVFSHELSADDVRDYAQGNGRRLLQDLSGDERLGAGAADMLSRFDADADAADLSRALAGVYGRLFHGFGGRRSAPPYQSVYESEEAATHGDAWRRMRVVLHELGLSVPEGFSEPEDHIAVQLAVVSHLCGAAADAADGGDRTVLQRSVDRLRDFLIAHPLAWGPAFAADCRAHSGDGFYAGAARVLMALLEEERAALGVSEATQVAGGSNGNN